MDIQPSSVVVHMRGRIHRVHIPAKRFLYLRHRHPKHNHRCIQNVPIQHNSAFQVSEDRNSDEILLYSFVYGQANHRLHDWSKYNQKVVEACARYCDVVSVNYYGRWQPETDFLANLKAWCGAKPFLVSEFYTKAEDASYQEVQGKTGRWLFT